MHSIHEMKFRRRFSINPYKTLRMKLGEMSCFKNWIDDRRGDPYPVLETTESESLVLTEMLPSARYRAENHTNSPLMKARLLGQHFPYATYEITLDALPSDGFSGLGVRIMASGEDGSAYDRTSEPCLYVQAAQTEAGKMRLIKKTSVGGVTISEETTETAIEYASGMSLIVTSRGMFFDVYLKTGALPVYICTYEAPEFKHILKYDTFVRSTASLLVSLAPGAAAQGAAEFYLEGGVSHADMKCMQYENGMPIMKDGKLFMTISVRLQAGGYQMVCSWNPSTADLKMEGAIFFDLGDGAWCSNVGSSIVYNRKTDEWYVWSVAFSHGHILCYATSLADLRYGIHVLDTERMPIEYLEHTEEQESLAVTTGGSTDGKPSVSDDRLFFGKAGDEDPNLVYDEKRGVWQLIICRLTQDGEETFYRYYLFESDNPFTGFTFVDRTLEGSNTGGSIIRVGGERYLLCGSGFNQRARYHLHPISDLSTYTTMRFDYDDGGFRGWGCLIPVPCGRRTRYVWMTFDRHNGSSYNWSYGNIHVFEADLMNDGWEWADKPGLLR